MLLYQYVFNGVGEMMSAGVVWRWQGEGGGGGAGAGGSRLGALRHCLAALHLPHDGLHRAQHYLHLLNCTPQVPTRNRTREPFCKKTGKLPVRIYMVKYRFDIES